MIIKSHKLYSHKLYGHPAKRCIYLTNHCDIYDFPIDTYLTGGNAMFISRYIPKFLFPIQYIMTTITKNTFYFKEYLLNDKVDFNKNIYTALTNSNYRNLIMYSEETRRHEDNNAYIAWSYNMCVQIIITKNKERIINLESRTSQYGVNLYCYRSQVINPEYFSSFKEFNAYVTLIWEESYGKIYECKDMISIPESLVVEPYIVK